MKRGDVMSQNIEPTPEDFAAVREGGSLDDDAVAGERYRLAQAHAMLRIFREGHGRDAETAEELGAWLEQRRTP
jgi:hypothetical protein